MAETVFNWDRVETLLGTRLHLDSQRTKKFPEISAKDNVAQITRKIMNYVKRSQDTTNLRIEDIADMIGMKPLGVGVPERIEKEIKSLTNSDPAERIMWFVTDKELPVAVCLSSSAKRTGSWILRGETIGDRSKFKVINLAHYALARQYANQFKATHPEYAPQVVDMYVNRLTDKSYSGKKWAHYWDEARWSRNVAFVTAACMNLEQVKPLIPDEVRQKNSEEKRAYVQTLSESQIRQILDQAPTVSTNYGNDREFYDLGVGGKFNKDYIQELIRTDSQPGSVRQMNRDWRNFLEQQYDIEYNAELQRGYVRENSAEHSATVYQQKKNIPQTHLDAAETSVFKTSKDFTHVEIDGDVDLASFNKIEKEYDLVRNFTGSTKPPTLRFRKTGRHKALGVYHPLFDNIAVDPRHPSSFLHEYAHHLDHTYGTKNLSGSQEFAPLLKQAQNALRQLSDEIPAKRLAYLMTPTEIFARTSELYYHWSGLETSLNGDADQYSEASYKALEPLKESITKYWDSAIEKMGGQIPNEKTINKHLEADKETSINQQTKIGVASTIEPISYGYQPSLFDDANRNRETTDTIKIPHQDSAHEYRIEPLELETIAAKYGGREVDWEKIAQYAPIQDDAQKTRNHQYDVDYPQPESSRFGHEISYQ